MTKTKALELMLEMSRAVIDPALARKIAKVFGYTLNDLGIKPHKVNEFRRLNYPRETENLTAVAVNVLAIAIAENKTGKSIYTRMSGAGSGAQDITEQAVELLKLNIVQESTGYVGSNEVDTLAAF